MNLPAPLLKARLIRRLNRFAAEVALDGGTVRAHVPNSGRLAELLVEGAEVWVHPVTRPGRATAGDLLLVRYGRLLVSVDSRAPARIAAEALTERGLPPIPLMDELRTEVALGSHRIDLSGRAQGREWLIEVKGCTLVEAGTALFPDAPTARGRRHLEALTEVVKKGRPATVLFVIQREDAERFRPHAAHDPAFAQALVRAHQAGVVVAAHRCRVSVEEVTLTEAVPVALASGV